MAVEAPKTKEAKQPSRIRRPRSYVRPARAVAVVSTEPAASVLEASTDLECKEDSIVTATHADAIGKVACILYFDFKIIIDDKFSI